MSKRKKTIFNPNTSPWLPPETTVEENTPRHELEDEKSLALDGIALSHFKPNRIRCLKCNKLSGPFQDDRWQDFIRPHMGSCYLKDDETPRESMFVWIEEEEIDLTKEVKHGNIDNSKQNT